MSIKRIAIGVVTLLAAWLYITQVPAYAYPVTRSGGAVYLPESSPIKGGRPDVKARLLPSGKASVPADAPWQVKRAIEAANRIVGKPYLYGGGHGSFKSSGYDCSGTVSYALRGAGLIKTPMASGPLMSWGRPGKGQWITVYSNPGHAFVHIAGLRLDTSAAEDPGGAKGPRWRKALRNTSAFVARSPRGF